ncbi:MULTISPECIES: LysR family transcriptional regulator [Vibrio]|uniref:LysR family transcriptional regulator n=1 Tax=Vibrio chemaguriensis TaxID=2527672 RepID=A0ABX1HVH3_9VIBR|nr:MULTISPECIES: LysR family transcriptional regulator [Vibrio]EJG0887820.1 LysR family transcriptional regulator [Vibrio parahaemolyticus]MBE4239313.1 LysR family transcriptional regulator [Vibrio parahaemolyticus]MDU9593764.1 LysR family transcriptional regulator [Vibrio sp. 2-1-2a]MDU9601565.1 LysR family transcriptional regulator [Vibrio sp. 1-2-3a]NKJ67507.1 LysR family transcriptional regulator [Vibrio chemaguriensis]
MDKSLQQFLLVARCQSISAAARMAGLSQPTVTSNLKKLEENLGVTLFERHPNGMVLTEYGRILYRHSNAMQHEYNQMMQSIDERKQYQVGKIKMGTGDAWWPLFVKQALNDHLTKQPSASTHVEFGNHLGLMDSLINEQIEFFIGHEIVGLSSKCDVTFIPLFQTVDAYFVSPNHPLLGKTVTEEMLHEYPALSVTYDAKKFAHVIDNPIPKQNERERQQLDDRPTYEVDSLLASIDVLKESVAVMSYTRHLQSYLESFGLRCLTMKSEPNPGTVGIYRHRRETSESHLDLIAGITQRAKLLN